MAIRTIEAIATNGFSGHCSRQQNDFASVRRQLRSALPNRTLTACR